VAVPVVLVASEVGFVVVVVEVALVVVDDPAAVVGDVRVDVGEDTALQTPAVSGCRPKWKLY
jgi:hypothetical protein